ncbi:MAG: hypothetical protein LBI87_11980 [Candidatus Accumulibacter sp.]|jgi:hypothetical protein|nr:hypothetical protein [Accumulibacter sp.]
MKFDTGKLEFKTPYLWGLFIAWVAWGQFVTYCVMYDHIPPFILNMANSVASSVPSIIRLNSKHDHYVLGVFLAQRIVALAMLSMPLLFILLLLADVRESISGIRRKRKGLIGMALFISVGLGVFLLSF